MKAHEAHNGLLAFLGKYLLPQKIFSFLRFLIKVEICKTFQTKQFSLNSDEY